MNQGEFIVMGIGVLILLGNAFTAWAVITGKAQRRDLGPQPFEVTMQDKPLTKSGHEAICGPLHVRVGALENRTDRIERKMEEDKNEMLKAGEVRAKDLHRRIDGIPAQVIALLKDTKGLIR